MVTNNIKCFLSYILISIIIFFHIFLTVLWLLRERNYYYCSNQSGYLLASSEYYKALVNANIKNFLCLFSSFIPPLPTIAPLPFYFIFGFTEKVAILPGTFNIFQIYSTDINRIHTLVPGALAFMNEKEIERLINYIRNDSVGKSIKFASLSSELEIIEHLLSFRGIKVKTILLHGSNNPFYPCILQADYSFLAKEKEGEKTDIQQMNQIINMFENASHPINKYFIYIDTFYLREDLSPKLYKRIVTEEISKPCSTGIFWCLT